MNRTEPRQLAIRLQLIYAALVAAVVVYVVVAWLAISQGGVHPRPLPDQLLAVLAALAAAQLLAGPAARRVLLKQLDGSGGVRPDPGAGLRIQRAYVLGAAVSEGVAVVGLVLTFLSGWIGWVAAFSAAAVISLLGAWPSESKIRSLLGAPDAPLEP